MADDVLTRNENDELAVRVVSTSGDTSTNPNDVYTRDENGKLCVRVTGGGGDQHNLGYFATLQALQEAYPTAEAGDWAIVGATDTVWIWDTDNSAWVDSDQKGQVTSVNNQTGAVTVQETLVNQTNIKSVNGNSLLGSGNLELTSSLAFPAGWTTNSTTKALCDDVAADSSAVAGKMYLGEVTCSDLPASIANSEVKVEIIDGTTAQTKVILLELTSGNVSPYRWQYTYWNGGSNVSGWKTWQEELVSGTNIKTVNNTSLLGSGNITIDSLPTQSGQSGKFLKTDGTDASWGSALVNVDTTHSDTLVVGGTGAGDSGNTVLGIGAGSYGGKDNTVVGAKSQGRYKSTVVGANIQNSSAQNMVVIGSGNSAQFTGSIEDNSFNWVLSGTVYKLMGSDGTIPKERLTNVVSTPATMPTLAVADWSSNTQTVNVTGVTATNVVFVSPAPASAADYASAGITCTAQGAGTLTFTCTTVPSNAITVNVVCL